MNHIFRTNCNETLSAWVATSERVSCHVKAGRLSEPQALSVTQQQTTWAHAGLFVCLLPLSPLFCAVCLALGTIHTAHAQLAPDILQTQGQVVAGQASISEQAAQMMAQQSSDKAIINWQTFNIGQDASVDFQQPNRQAVTLNRVVSNNASQLYGQLLINGHQNPNPAVDLIVLNNSTTSSNLLSSTFASINTASINGASLATQTIRLIQINLVSIDLGNTQLSAIQIGANDNLLIKVNVPPSLGLNNNFVEQPGWFHATVKFTGLTVTALNRILSNVIPGASNLDEDQADAN